MDATTPHNPKVAIVVRGDNPATVEDRFAAVFAALRAEGLAPEACPYAEESEAATRTQIAAVDAALVWVNPVQDGRRRAGLDALLREAAAAGVRVSAHPDIIDRLGTKSVLWRTRELGWSGDARWYPTPEALRAEFPAALATGARVLKPNRGNGGAGVLKVEAVGDGAVRAQAAEGDGQPREAPLAEFLAAQLEAFAAADGFVDQAFQPRLPDGMVRCYLAGDRVAGFGFQKVRALMPAGTPAMPRLYSGPDDARFQRLRRLMEEEWAPALRRILGMTRDDLPAIWDADLLFGPVDPQGRDSFVLCEINASSVFPIPAEAPAALAATLAARLRASSPVN